MKISRITSSKCECNCEDKDLKEVKSSEFDGVLDTENCICEEPILSTPSHRDEACCLIKQAIDKLAEIAQEDEQAKSSIADLSVVLFDLK